jgi:hypothetical protein
LGERGIKFPVLAQEARNPIAIAARINGIFRKMFIKNLHNKNRHTLFL